MLNSTKRWNRKNFPGRYIRPEYKVPKPVVDAAERFWRAAKDRKEQRLAKK